MIEDYTYAGTDFRGDPDLSLPPGAHWGDIDEMYVQNKDKLQQQNHEKRYEGYKLEEDGFLIYKNKIYVPNVEYLRRVVMDEIHQAPYSSHPGYQKTIATARKQYFWLGMKKDMAEYISRCMKCQQDYQ